MEALYSKYRPKVLSDVVGQHHILQTLENAIESDKISHAYMFCGPRGTGKTTMARLLAKACICSCASDRKRPSTKFCGKCEDCVDIAKGSHPDVYELDAASRTGVENVREEIISRVGYAATRGDKKIYIIDEVHMLSTAAFNALLKTLEEPPEHVIFILCTTDPQKVPETILSRCQRFDFNAISTSDIINRLQDVCKLEGVSAQDSALQLIAEGAHGAMRNALANLEQAIAYTNGQITLENLEESLSIDAQIDYSVLIECLGMRNLPGSFDWVAQVSDVGVDFTKICNSLIQIFRNMYVKSAGAIDIELEKNIEDQLGLFSTERLHRILIILSDLNAQIKTSNNLRLSFEIAMARIANPKSDLTLESLAERIANLELVATAGDLSPAYAIEKPQVEASEKVVKDKPSKADIPRKVVKVKKEEVDKVNVESADSKQSPAETVPNIKIPERPQAHDFSADRAELKEEANIQSPANNNSGNLSDETELQKKWHIVFSKIRSKYPAFGATLLTASPSFDEANNQFVLKFPGSASFSVGVLKKAESMQRITAEIKSVMGEDIGFNIVIDDTKDETFNPQFSNNFRKSSVASDIEDDDLFPDDQIMDDTINRAEVSVQPPINEESDSGNSIKDMLNNFGAYNITEE